VSIESDLREFIVGELHYTGDASELTADYLLLDRGAIDSLGIIRLVSFIEEKWSIEVDDEELVPESFESLGAIVGMIERHLE
jgi:acyl carrier protein